MMTLSCPRCGKQDVLRAPCQRAVEYTLSLLCISPFKCQSCGQRFLALRVGRLYRRGLIDRRAHRRIPVKLHLCFSGGRVNGQGLVRDISMGGCLVETVTPVREKDIFYLQLFVDQKKPPIEVPAIARSIRTGKIGFEFMRSAKDNKRLVEFLHSQGAA